MNDDDLRLALFTLRQEVLALEMLVAGIFATVPPDKQRLILTHFADSARRIHGAGTVIPISERMGASRAVFDHVLEQFSKVAGPPVDD